MLLIVCCGSQRIGLHLLSKQKDKMTHKEIELRSEYESTYLAYGNMYSPRHLSFEDWLVIYKNKKPKRKTREELIDRLIENLRDDFENGDYTVLEELLGFIPNKKLIGSLNEEEWVLFKNLK